MISGCTLKEILAVAPFLFGTVTFHRCAYFVLSQKTDKDLREVVLTVLGEEMLDVATLDRSG